MIDKRERERKKVIERTSFAKPDNRLRLYGEEKKIGSDSGCRIFIFR